MFPNSNDLNAAEMWISEIGKQALSLYALEASGIASIVDNDRNLLSRNLKRGFVWYLSNELENEVLTQNSNLRRMDVKKAIDDTVFNSAASLVIEQANLAQRVDSVVSNVLPRNALTDAIVASIFVVGTRKVGEKLENNVIKNVSNFFLK